MCGIAGCISRNKTTDKEKFERMVDIIRHRGPDDRGTFYENEIALGHRRLSIIDLSPDGRQPFFYQDRYVVVFNGEIYNYVELKEELCRKGYTFKTRTDTEVLAAAYDCWKAGCVRKFNGMWAFAVYDRAEQKIFCSRDRFGIKPFYYTQQEGMFLFASEIKQFFEMLHHNPRANRECLLQFIIRGHMDYCEETMFQDIFQLPGGSNLVYNLSQHTYQVKRYYDIRNVSETDKSYQRACREFYRKFYHSVDLRLRADVPVGYCLSGGLDSSSIVCMADRILKERGNGSGQHTISSCFEDKRYDEQEYIDEVVSSTDVTPHKVFPQESRLFSDLDRIIWHMDEPFASTSVYAQWNVFQAAAENGLKVMLDGQGADEQLAGYTGFYKVLFFNLLKKGQFQRFRKEWKIYKKDRASTENHISVKELLLSTVTSLFLPDCFKYLLKRIYFKLPGKEQPFSPELLMDALKKEKVPEMKEPRLYIADSMYLDMPELLHYEDRDSMAHSIESRVPFLDYRLAELVYSLPFSYKLHRGITKAVLRDALTGLLPDKIRNRYSKLGFVTPEDQWINNNFERYKEELKKSVKSLSGLLDEKRVMEWFDKNQGIVKRQDFTTWRIICAGHWAELFHVSIS